MVAHVERVPVLVIHEVIVPVPCHSHASLWIGSEVSAAQDPILLIPVLVSTVPVFVTPVELVPEFVVPVLFSIGATSVQLSSIVPIRITTLSFCVPLYDSVSMTIPVGSVSVIDSLLLLLSTILVVA